MLPIILLFVGCRSVEPEPIPVGFRDAYTLSFETVIPKISELMETDCFSQQHLQLTKHLCQDEKVLQAIQTALCERFEQATLLMDTPDSYIIKYVDNGVERTINCTYNNGAIRATTEGDFFKFVPLDNGMYALQDSDEMALIQLDEQGIKSAVYARMKRSIAVDTALYQNDIRTLDQQADSIFGATHLDASWITDKREDLMLISTYENGEKTVSTCSCEYVFDRERQNLERVWKWNDEPAEAVP